jgi:predicted secreted hydrolase
VSVPGRTAFAPTRAFAFKRTMMLSTMLSMTLAIGLPTTARAEVRYPPVVPGVELQLPQDEGSHPPFRIEWWYVTGWLDEGVERPTGFQVTFFRVRTGLAEDNPSRFSASQVLFAHAAVADPARGKLLHAQRSARVGFGLAEAREGRVDVTLDDWSMRQDGDRYLAVVRDAEFAFDLELRRIQSPMLQGEAGFSRKGPDPRAASYYYSLPQLEVSGELVVDGKARRVSGRAWFDHEWSSDYVDESATGWDWIGINLADGGALMAFRMRDGQGGERWAGATLRSADGSVQSYAPDEIEWTPLRRWRSPRTGTEFPVAWRARIGHREFEIEPLMDDAELDSRRSTGTIYWEGPVRLLEQGRETGKGYLELTGYAGEMQL